MNFLIQGVYSTANAYTTRTRNHRARLIRRSGPHTGPKLKLTLSGTALALAASYIPDLDFIPGIVIGDHFAFHHGPSHSLLFGLIAGLAFAAFSWKVLPFSFGKRTLFYSSLVWIHILLDMSIIDTRVDDTPGVQLFYPFSSVYVKSPVDLFFVDVGSKGSLNPLNS